MAELNSTTNNATGTQVPPRRRKRLTTACESCRRRKIRCDGEGPCGPCAAQRLDCIYRQSQTKRGPRPRDHSSQQAGAPYDDSAATLSASGTSASHYQHHHAQPAAAPPLPPTEIVATKPPALTGSFTMRAHAHSPPVPMPTPLAAPVPLGMRSSDAAYYPQPGAADGHQDWPLQLQQQHQYTHQYAHQHHPQAFFQHQHYAYPLADGPMSPFSGASSSAASSAASSGRDWSHSPSPPVLGVSGGAVGAVDSPFPSPYAPTIAPSAEADYALPPVGALRVSDWPPPPHRRPTSPGSTLNAAVPVATASAAGNGMPPRASPRMYHPYQLPIQSAAAAPVASPTYLPDPRSLSGMPTPRLVRPLPLTSASAGGSGSFTGSISSPTFSWPLQSPQRAATNKASWTPPSPRPRGRSSSSMSMPELTTRAAPPPLPTATAAAGADAALSLPPLWSVVRPDQDPMRGPAPPLPPPATPRPSRSLPSFQHLLAPSSIAAPVVGGSVAAATPMVDDDVWLGAPPGDAPPPQQPAHWFAPRH